MKSDYISPEKEKKGSLLVPFSILCVMFGIGLLVWLLF